MASIDLSAEFWLQLLVFIVVTGAGGVGGLLFFVLRGIRENQTRIWDWAIAEVKSLHGEVRLTHSRHTADQLDNRRWIRHEIRTMYQAIIVLTQQLGTEGAKDLEADIHARLAKGEL